MHFEPEDIDSSQISKPETDINVPFPGTIVVHDLGLQAIVDLVEIQPVTHLMHLVAPVLLRVSVTFPEGQSSHSLVGLVPNLPAAHLVHFDAPVPLTDPGEQALQSDRAALPVTSTNLPALQPSHSLVGSAPNLPAAHLVHFDAPVPVRVSVTDPGEQALQSDRAALPVTSTNLPALQPSHSLVGSAPNLPAAHLVHFDAPVPVRVSVTDPGEQAWHWLLAQVSEKQAWNVPLAQAVHLLLVTPCFPWPLGQWSIPLHVISNWPES